MTGTRSNPGAGFALGRMGFVIGSPKIGLDPSRYTLISAIEASILPLTGRALLLPYPGALRMRALCSVVLLVSFPSRRLSALHGGDVSG